MRLDTSISIVFSVHYTTYFLHVWQANTGGPRLSDI